MLRKWTKAFCSELARGYSSRIDFKRGHDGAYQAAVKNGWLDEICGHMTPTSELTTKWTLVACRAVAAGYSDRTKFKVEHPGAYRVAMQKGWLASICSHMADRRVEPRQWTDVAIAEVLGSCKTHAEFRGQYPTVYAILRHRGTLRELTKHLPRRAVPNGYWTKERCAEIAAKCGTRLEFVRANQSAYKVAQENGWLDELCSHMRVRGNQKLRLLYAIIAPGKKRIYIGLSFDAQARYEQHKERGTPLVRDLLAQPHRLAVCSRIYDLNEAAILEKRLIAHFKRKGWLVANISKGGGLGLPDKHWTRERLQDAADCHETRREFARNDPRGYNAAVTSGLLDALFEGHPNQGMTHRKFTDAMLQAIADTCVTRKDFELKDGSAHRAASRRGIMDKLFERHPDKGLLKKPEWSMDEIRQAAASCQTRKEFENEFPNEYDAARYRGLMDDLFAGHTKRGYKK